MEREETGDRPPPSSFFSVHARCTLHFARPYSMENNRKINPDLKIGDKNNPDCMHVRKNTNQHLTPLPDPVRADSRFPGRNRTKIHSTLLPQRAARALRLTRAAGSKLLLFLRHAALHAFGVAAGAGPKGMRLKQGQAQVSKARDFGRFAF